MSSLLIVDNDRSIIRIFQRCFEHSEVEVHSATSAAEAVGLAAALQPDVVARRCGARHYSARREWLNRV